jgi:hypothetical protein
LAYFLIGLKNLFYLNNITIEKEIIEDKFACDLSKCKGTCCTFPGAYGAPVLDSEIEQLTKAKYIVWDIIPDKAKKKILKSGVYEGKPGNYTTVCINKRDCVFVYYHDDIALCAIEKAYFEHKIDFRKPLSCHLFPIRIRKNGNDVLHYQQIEECKPAVIKGLKDETYLHQFLKDALIRTYGDEFYTNLLNYISITKNLSK